MIIKSMSRKEPTFTQLYDYITREDDYDPDYVFTQNFFLRDRENILKEFHANAQILPKRANGNYLYHEIISITRAKGIDEAKQKALLRDLVAQYAKDRAGDCLVFGGLHDEKDNQLHFHLIISANKQGDHKRFRLKKADFNQIKIQLEQFTLECHPELEQDKLISKHKKTSAKTSHKEQEYKRRTGKPSHKDVFKDKLKTIFNAAVDKADFFKRLEKAKIEIYTRGKTIGFKDLINKRNHRLKTLGLENEFEYISSKLDPDSSQGKPKKDQDPTLKDHATSAFNPKEAFKDVAKEIFTGNFKERDKKIRAQKATKTGKTHTKVKPEALRTFRDKIGQSANEWIFGDFSQREAQERLTKWQKADKKAQASIKATKDKADQSTIEKVIETGKEWVMGDFTARDNRAKKAEQAKDKKERKAAYIRKQKLADKKLKPQKAKAKKQERIENWKKMKEKEQEKLNKTKPKKEQTVGENIRENVKEWVFGDFTARENRARQDELKKEAEEKKKTRTDKYAKDREERRDSVQKMRDQIDRRKGKDLDKER